MTPIYVVSGLPRSGTSLMMRMLEAAGLEPVTDGTRTADEDNPRGYYELEAVKQLETDPSFLLNARGKAVKIISDLLIRLPATEQYRVIFMRRHLEEVLASQKKMLERRGAPYPEGAQAEMKRDFILHLADVEAWIKNAPHVTALFVSYNRLLAEPASQIARLARFLDLASPVDETALQEVVEPGLYRQRQANVKQS